MSGGGGGARLEVLWAATAGVGTALTDKFLTWGADISLYEVAPLSQLDGKPSYITLSERTGAVLVASNSNCQYVKCVDVCGTGWQEPLLALGHANGKVLLTSFGHGDTARELVPRHARTCNSVAWNRSEQSMLATALDKYRSDHCILLWDVNKCTSSDGSTSPHVNSGMSSSWQGPVGAATAGVELARPIAEMGLSETAHSVAWTHFGCRLLLASMNQKHIKIFDLRDFSNKAVTVANTKYCYGVCADPFNEWQVASRAECTVCVWDARHPERPLLTLPQPKPVTSILWCPTRRNLLGSLQRDSRSLHLHDLQQAPDLPSSPSSPPANSDPAIVNCTESGACVLERSVSLSSGHTITGFSWHPTHQARLLAIAVSGKIMEYTVLERVTVSWGGGGDGGGGGQLVWSHGGRALHTPPVAFLAAHRDISHKMKSRATTDYGLKPELLLNGDLADDEGLKNLWKWLFRSKSLVEEGCIRGTQWRHPGVRSALKMEAGCATAAGGYRSEAVPALATDLGTLHYTTYKSAERTHALQLCGWGWQSVSAALGKLEAEGPASRAAAVAVFHLRFRDALDILGRAPQNSLRVVALALAGYSEERGVWRDLATLLLGSKAALDDAYLRAVLSFLTSDGHDYKAVLNESEMRLEDRVAFACLFLDDSRLQEYVRTLSAKLTAHGDLDGILLTGMSTDGIALLQRWVDHSGDVQSAALLAARTFTADMLRDLRVVDWIARWLAAVVVAVRIRHVGGRRGGGDGRGGRGGGGRGGGRGRRGGGGAAPAAGVHLVQLLRQDRVGAARARPHAHLRSHRARRQQDEANFGVPELPQAAAALRRVPAAHGHGGGRGGRGGRGGVGGGGRWRRSRVPRLVHVVRGVPARRARQASAAVVSRTPGVSGELVHLSLSQHGPAKPAQLVARPVAPLVTHLPATPTLTSIDRPAELLSVELVITPRMQYASNG